MYEANGYRLFWSDGQKPTASAISLLQQLRLAGERGLDPADYPVNRLAYLLTDFIDAPHSGLEQWALFNAGFAPPALDFPPVSHRRQITPLPARTHPPPSP